MIPILLLVVGFVLLVKGADYFVDGASSIAKNLKIPAVVIGLTVVAFGTSAPELAVSLTAALNGSNDIAMGNVVGSNLVNLLVVVGISAIFNPLSVKKTMILKDYPFTIIASAILLFLSYDFTRGSQLLISRGDGFVLLILFGIFMYSVISDTLRSKDNIMEDETLSNESKPMGSSILITIIGLVSIVVGGNLVVNSATSIARVLGISETLIGLTIVAIGTSLPELVTSVMAAKKGESDIALGNVVGSNIMNIFLILGTSAAIHPIAVNIFSIYDIIILISVSIIFFIPIIFTRKINRLTGILMIGTYIGYTAYIIMR